MSKVKVYDGEKWVTVASSRASEISVTDKTLCTSIDKDGNITESQSTNVEKVLSDMKESIDLAQRNISWLALHGGGGAAGGSGGSGSTVSGYILVNSEKNGKDIVLNDSGLKIEIKASGSNWSVAAVSGSTPLITSNSKSLIITKDAITEQGLTETFPISITAYNTETMSSLYWDGNIYVNNISISGQSEITTKYNEYDSVNLTYVFTSGIEQDYKLFINSKLYKQYTISTQGITVSIPLGDIDELIGGLTPGAVNKITLRLESVTNPSLFVEKIAQINIQTDSPLISCSTLSTDHGNPTTQYLYGSSVTIPMPFIVYYANENNSSFKYTIRSGEPSDINKSDWENIGYYAYNSVIGNSSYLISNASVSEENSPEAITIYILTANGTVYHETYYIKLVKPKYSFMDIDGGVENATVFDFSSFNGEISGATWSDVHKHVYKDEYYKINIEQQNSYNVNIHNNTNNTGPYLRLQNASYGVIPMWKGDIAPWYVNGQGASFSLELCFHADYHPDDDRVIFHWGILSDETAVGRGYIPSSGLTVRAHDVYVGNDKLLSLEDDEDIHLTFTYQTTGGKGLLFVYLDGVIEAVKQCDIDLIIPWINNSNYPSDTECSIYLAAAPFGNEIISYTDVNIFHVKLINSCLNPYQVLVEYLNDQAKINYTDGEPNIKLITDGQARNFISGDESKLYNTEYPWKQINEEDRDFLKAFNLSNFIQQNGNKTTLNTNIKNFNIPIPVIFIDVSANSNWTWENFITPQSSSTKLDAASGGFNYYDQQLDGSKIISGVSVNVSQQGTSTLADFIKNLNIEFQDNVVFIPKETWFPEKKYTLKADIVDSSHSLNTSIGKFVNEEFGLDEKNQQGWYPFASPVLSSFQKQKNDTTSPVHTCFPKATLKHGVEGFPVFLIMKFAVADNSSNDTGVHTLGIYQFILGRESPRNLGYEMITDFQKNDGTKLSVKDITYPYLGEDITLKTEDNNYGAWLEFNQNDSSNIDIQKESDSDFKGTKLVSPFWQPMSNSANYYDSRVEVKYQKHDNSTPDIIKASTFEPFKDFVDSIVSLPVNYRRHADIGVGGKMVMTDFAESYDTYQYEANESGEYAWNKTGKQNTIASASDTLKATVGKLNVESIGKYQAICMFLGLIDNFLKNMPLKFYQNKNNEYEPAILGIYDTDTGCGQNNQGEVVNNEYMWFTGLKNNEAYNLTECGNAEAVNKTNNGGTPTTINSKLWTIDTPSLNNTLGSTGDKSGSIFADYWYEFVNHFNTKYGGTSPAQVYYEKYFLPQTKGCGELLFNLTYIAKYVNNYIIDPNTKTKGNQIQKLHGRRRYQVKKWLENRVDFLNGMYAALGVTSQGTESYTISSLSINSVSGPVTSVTMNTPIIMHYTNEGGNGDRWVICDKNKPSKIFFGSTNIGLDPAVSHTMAYPSHIIQLGEGNHPLYDMGFSTINTGSLPYLTEYNTSVGTRSEVNKNYLGAMSSDYMENHFTRSVDGKNISELRTIDFRNTYPKGNNTSYELNIENGFTKLQNLYISNSCLTKVDFPTDVALRDIEVNGSKLNELTLKEQSFIDNIDLTDCKNLTMLNITNCKNLKTIKVDSTNSSLTSVNISSDTFESFVASDVKNLTTVNISSLQLKSITITNCENLKTLNFNADNIANIYIKNCNSLECINFQSTTVKEVFTNTELTSFKIQSCPNFKYTQFNGTNDVLYSANTLFISDADKDVNIIDLSKFTNLSTISFKGCSSVEYVQFKNDKNDPINLQYSDGYSPFKDCSSLIRIFGNILCGQSGIFMQNYKFSIHGYDCNNVKWQGKPIMYNGRVMIPAEVTGAITHAASTSIVESTVKATMTKVKDFNSNKDNFYQSGERATNIEAKDARNLFYQTSCSLFDIYYIFANVCGCTRFDYAFQDNRTTAQWGSPYSSSCRFIMNTTAGDADNSPNRYMFVSCENVTSLRFCLRGGGSKFRIFTPITTNSETGLLSPLKKCSDFGGLWYGQTYVTDKNVFRLSAGDFAAEDISWFSPIRMVVNANALTTWPDSKSDTDGDISGFFTNLGNLKNSLSAVLRLEYIDFTTINENDSFKIPKGINTLASSIRATYGKGDITKPDGTDGISKYFASPSSVQYIYQSFWGGKGSTLYISNNFFSEFNNLRKVSYLTTGDFTGSVIDSSFCGDMTKKIVGQFPFDILSDTPNIEEFAGFFSNSSFAEESASNEILKLPGSLFVNTPKLTNCGGLFYNVGFQYGLSETDTKFPNNFVNCPNLQNVSYAFSRTGNCKANTNGLTSGYIPNKFFYHGASSGSVTLYGTDNEWTESVVIDSNHKISGQNYVIIESVDDNTEKTTTYFNISPSNQTSGSVIITRTPATRVNITTATALGEETTSTTKTNYYGNMREGFKKDEVLCYTYTPKATITDASYCFRGANLEPYRHEQITLDDVEDYSGFSPFEYIYNDSNKTWSKNINKCTQKHTYMWAYDGDKNNTTTISLSEIKDSSTTSDYDETYDQSWYHYDDVNPDNTDTIESSHPMSIMPKSLSYCCPPDLLRYCNPNCLVQGLFAWSGIDGWDPKWNGDRGSISDWGIYGRIPPLLLYPVYNTTNITDMFRYCRRLSSYSDLTNHKSYLIPPKFFNNARSVNNMTYTFAGTFMPSTIDLVVFNSLYTSNNLTLDHTFFYTCYGDGATVRDCFVNYNVSNIKACFARHDTEGFAYSSTDTPHSAAGGGPAITSTSGSSDPGGKMTFTNVFNSRYANKVYGTDSDKSFVFAGYDKNYVTFGDQTLPNNVTTKNYMYFDGTTP